MHGGLYPWLLDQKCDEYWQKLRIFWSKIKWIWTHCVSSKIIWKFQIFREKHKVVIDLACNHCSPYHDIGDPEKMKERGMKGLKKKKALSSSDHILLILSKIEQKLQGLLWGNKSEVSELPLKIVEQQIPHYSPCMLTETVKTNLLICFKAKPDCQTTDILAVGL